MVPPNLAVKLIERLNKLQKYHISKTNNKFYASEIVV